MTIKAALPLFLLAFCSSFSSAATDLDRLVGKLVEKGVLSGEEASVLLAVPAGAKAAPEIKAELRLRYQHGDNRGKSHSRPQGRYAVRVGGEAQPGESTSLAFGLASGSDAGARSANQTFGRNMEKKGIYLDHAYAEYRPSGWARLRGGRMPLPLWDPTDMVWDSDLRMEGASVLLKRKTGGAELFSSAGFAALSESLQEPRDPHLLFAQQGYSGRLPAGGVSLKCALAGYAFGELEGGQELPGRPSAGDGYLRSNSAPGGRYSGDYDAVHASLELRRELEARPLPGLEAVSIFGEAIKNITRSADSAGWIAGFRAGSLRPDAAGQWQFAWSLRRLEAEAWLDTYPDSDFYGGAAGVKGTEVSLNLGLGGGALLGLDYYRSRPIAAGARETLLQADFRLRL